MMPADPARATTAQAIVSEQWVAWLAPPGALIAR